MNAPAALLFTLLEGCTPSGHQANASSEPVDAVAAVDFSALQVAADSEACIKEEAEALKLQMDRFWDTPTQANLTQPGFPFNYATVNPGSPIQLGMALQDGPDRNGASYFLADVGHTIYRGETAAALSPYHDQWQAACPGSEEADFYRSAYLLAPAFGPEGFARCLPVEDRCGDF